MIWFLNGVSWNSNRHLDIDYNKIFKCLFNKVWWEKDIRHWSHGYDFSFDCTSSDSSNLHFDKTAWNINDNHIISQQSILYNVSWNSNSGIKPAYIDDKNIIFYWNVLCPKWQKPLMFFVERQKTPISLNPPGLHLSPSLLCKIFFSFDTMVSLKGEVRGKYTYSN